MFLLQGVGPLPVTSYTWGEISPASMVYNPSYAFIYKAIYRSPMSLHLELCTKFESRSESDEQKRMPEQPLQPVGHFVFPLLGFA